jgi:hypothetical protein
MILIASVYHRTNVLHKGQRVLRYPTLTRPGDWKSRQPLRSGPTATEELASKGWLRKPCGDPSSRRSLIAWFQPPDKKWGTASHRVVRAISRWERATAAVAHRPRHLVASPGPAVRAAVAHFIPSAWSHHRQGCRRRSDTKWDTASGGCGESRIGKQVSSLLNCALSLPVL